MAKEKRRSTEEERLLNVKYIAINDPKEIQAMEQGENGWREVTLESGGLVPCTAPITGTVYRIRSFGGLIDEYYPKSVIIRTLGSKKGRLFFDAEGVMRMVVDLPQEEFEILVNLIAQDACELAGISD